MVLRRQEDGCTFIVSNIYGPVGSTLKAAFFQELRLIGARSEGVWTVIDDFNVLLSLQDKNGPPSIFKDMLGFRRVVSELGLIDLPILNRSFTWTNGRCSPTLERLDRAFISKDWHLLFPISTLRALPRPRSDHSPLVLTAFTFIPAPSIFRFESFWLRYQSITNVITNAWGDQSPGPDADSGQVFSSKISRVRGALCKWSEGLTSTIKSQANLCLSWILWLDTAEEARPLSAEEGSLRPRLKERYEELYLQDELKWKQRLRVQWLKAGDSNTKFFHQKASCRRRKNFIFRLSDGSSFHSSHSSLADLLLRFFKNLLGREQPPEVRINLAPLFSADNIDVHSLQAPFSVEEIKSVVFARAPDKAPGPDGFSMVFFQRYWSVVQADILAMFFKLFAGQLNLTDVNESWICLIPKRSEVLTARDLRPISLVNSLVKIISKVLASRLQRLMDGLINPFQLSSKGAQPTTSSSPLTFSLTIFTPPRVRPRFSR